MRFGILTLDLADPLSVGDVARLEGFAVHFVEGDDIADRRNGGAAAAGTTTAGRGHFSGLIIIRLSHQTDPFGYHITLLDG